jgi:flavin reductase (DIM6/NTAB) family NADH-FMN oxidoreductase RutF
MKIERRPTTALLPTPVVIVSVAGDAERDANLITIAWTGVVCSSPPMLSIAVRPSRYSYGLLTAAREFVVNIPSVELVEQVDLAGMWSGKQHDKIAELGLETEQAAKVRAPLLVECPINLECVVRHQLHLGAHDLFVAEIVAVHYDDELLDSRGRLRTRAVGALAYVDGDYFTLGQRVGQYGYSVKQRKNADGTAGAGRRRPRPEGDTRGVH